jgi:hypothetical protein
MKAKIVFNDGSTLTLDDVDYAEPSTANPNIFIFEKPNGTVYLKLDSVIYIDLQEVEE